MVFFILFMEDTNGASPALLGFQDGHSMALRVKKPEPVSGSGLRLVFG
jgi:hypothetical protein